jgi:uncharacterized protein YhhL (DUF1145 family)
VPHTRLKHGLEIRLLVVRQLVSAMQVVWALLRLRLLCPFPGELWSCLCGAIMLLLLMIVQLF